MTGAGVELEEAAEDMVRCKSRTQVDTLEISDVLVLSIYLPNNELQYLATSSLPKFSLSRASILRNFIEIEIEIEIEMYSVDVRSIPIHVQST